MRGSGETVKFLLTTCLCVVVLHVSCVAQQCSNPPPGVRKMVRGVDITELDLTPIGITGPNGFKGPVINFTCTEGNTWTSPRGGKYQLPDQIWHLTTVPGGWLAADVKLYKDHHQIRRSLTNSVGGEAGIWKFSFSASYSYQKMQNSITNTSHYISDVSAYDSATMADFNPSWALKMDEFAQYYINNLLTGDFTSNPNSYRRFIEEFGTHYFAKAYFGGYIRIVLETDTGYFSSKTDTQVKKEAKASFLKIISLNGASVSESTNVDETFRQQTTQSVSYFGGHTNLLDVDGIIAWQSTVFTDPWLFSGQLRPISDLITDPTKKASMVQAVTDHVLRTYVEELSRLMDVNGQSCNRRARRRSWESTISSSRDLKQRVAEMKNSAVLTEEVVDALSQEVDRHVRALAECARTRSTSGGSSRTISTRGSSSSRRGSSSTRRGRNPYRLASRSRTGRTYRRTRSTGGTV